MSLFENSLYSYLEARLLPLERRGQAYFFRNNSFSGRIRRFDGSEGFIKNNKKGTPDVIILLDGQFIGAELKTATGRQSPAQKQAQVAIEAAGGRYCLFRSPEDIEAVLRELL